MAEIQRREAEAARASSELRDALTALKRRLDELPVENGLERIADELAGRKNGG